MRIDGQKKEDYIFGVLSLLLILITLAVQLVK